MGEAAPLTAPASMDAETAAALAATLHALAAPSRLLILDTIRQRTASVGEISAAIGMEQSAVSHQLGVLRRTGLITGERHGKQVHYRLHDHHVAELLDSAFRHASHVGKIAVPRTVPHPRG